MADHTPNGWPYPQPADALVDYPALAEQLAELLDTHALIGLPAMRINGADWAVPANVETLAPFGTTVFGQGGMAAFQGGIQVPRTAVYQVSGQHGWQQNPSGYRQARITTAGVEVARSVVTPPTNAAIQTLGGAQILTAGSIVQLYSTHDSSGPLTAYGGFSWLSAVLVADIPPGLLRDLIAAGLEEAR